MTTAIINLRDLYPKYELDCLVEVSSGDVDDYTELMTEEIAQVFFEEELKRLADLRKMYRYKAYYSLDCGDGIEHEMLGQEDDILTKIIRRDDIGQLSYAISSLPTTQARRIHAHFILGMSKSAIARQEGVDEKSVRVIIQRGLDGLKKIL